MQKKVVFYNKHKQRLSGVLHIPKKWPAPVVIVTHGFTSSKYTKEDICNFLANKGFLALRFDFNGHGESYGDFRDFTLTKCVEDLATAVEFVKGQKYAKKKIGINGTSLGGLVLMIYASFNDVNALTPFAAPFNMDDTAVMRDSEVAKQWKEHGLRYFYVRTKGNKKERKGLSYNFVIDREKYDMNILTKKIGAPALIIHGDKDATVPVKHAKMYYDALQAKKKLVILQGADHRLADLSKKNMSITLKETAAWFAKYL